VVCSSATSYTHNTQSMHSIPQFMIILITSVLVRGLPSLLMYILVWQVCIFYHVILLVGKSTALIPFSFQILCRLHFPAICFKTFPSYSSIKIAHYSICIMCWNSLICLIKCIIKDSLISSYFSSVSVCTQIIIKL